MTISIVLLLLLFVSLFVLFDSNDRYCDAFIVVTPTSSSFQQQQQRNHHYRQYQSYNSKQQPITTTKVGQQQLRHHKLQQNQHLQHSITTTYTSLLASSLSSSNDNNNNNNVLKAILWDMDGVLADTERDGHRIAFNIAFQEYNIDHTIWDIDTYGKLLKVGGGKERMKYHFDQIGWPTLYKNYNDEEKWNLLKQLHLRKTEIFNNMIQSNTIPLRSGVLRIIDDAINNNITLAVCSTSSEFAVRNLVKTLMGMERYESFTIFAGDMVQRKKPNPDIYLLAIDTLQLNKEYCIIIEDSEIGSQAAHGANVCCLVTKSSYTKNENFNTAIMIVNELGEYNNENTDNNNDVVTLETLKECIIQYQLKQKQLTEQ